MATDAKPALTGAVPRLVIRVATSSDRDAIYRLRHEIYAREIGQHAPNDAGSLQDGLDEGNVYLVALWGAVPAGFISITPPGRPAFSVDKYFPRSTLPFAFDAGLFEVRLLSVVRPHRGTELAAALMYGALRWVAAHGGDRIVALGRCEVVDLYRRVGLERVGFSTRSGRAEYELLTATVPALQERLGSFSGLLARLEARVDWRLPVPFRQPAPCFHGGRFFTAIGERFDRLEARHDVINADVLDAWFPPAPGVLQALHENLSWILRTSPPTSCEGLVRTIAEVRGVAPANILPGGGSSDLIFRAFRAWLTPASRVLLLDPTYGEYAHVLEQVIGCRVDRWRVDRARGYELDPGATEPDRTIPYDLVVLVNPNSPTGRHVPRSRLELLLRGFSRAGRIWIDETYVDYVGRDQSLERMAAASSNVIVCKSMSKAYALSGARVAYLCASAPQLEALRAVTPPWVVGLPGQIAGVRALQDPAYYSTRYAETARLREILAQALRALGWEVVPGCANFLLAHLPESGPDAATVVESARARRLFLRDAGRMGTALGRRALRVAVKDDVTNRRMVEILAEIGRAG